METVVEMVEKELAGDRVLGAVQNANSSLFYIMNHTKNENIKALCKETIANLTKNFHVLGLCSKCDLSPK